MSLQQLYSRDGVTVGATTYDVPSNTTTASSLTTQGLWHMWADPVVAMAKGDYFQVRVLEKVLSTSTQRLAMSASLGNAHAEAVVMPPLLLMHGWAMGCKKVAGTDRAFDFSVRGNNAPVTQAYSQSALNVGTTELSLTGGTSTIQARNSAGVYQVWIDGANMVKGDEFELRIYEKVEPATGVQRQVYEATLHDVQAQLFVSPLIHLINGWDVTLKCISSTARQFDASIRQVT